MNAKITLSHSDFPRYKIKGFSEALDFLNERAVGTNVHLSVISCNFERDSIPLQSTTILN